MLIFFCIISILSNVSIETTMFYIMPRHPKALRWF
uniref:Uncharacterized protein n=1 Tax=Arundo donax TaxID=35708 RepID=A0A0A8ZM60_ARUDO